MHTHAHDSHHCSVHHNDIEASLNEARLLCEKKGSRFTTLRQDIYRLILSSHKPLGAYDLISQLQSMRKDDNKPANVAPPTVYRSLDFLLTHGLIHQLNSINAFVPCCHPRQNHAAAFLICESCQSVEECSDIPVDEIINHSQTDAGFVVKKSTIELSGICLNCQADNKK